MDRTLKFTILSLSFLTIITGSAVAPSLSVIGRHFSAVNPSLIKLILTLPALVLVPFSLLSGKLTLRYSKKHILIVGLLLYTLGGVGGAAALNITFLLIMRIILGIGVGLILPLSTGLIADFYSGHERAKLMGYSTAVNNLGAVTAILLSGYLSSIHWRLIFFIYSVALIILLLVLTFLKNPPAAKKSLGQTSFSRESSRKKLLRPALCMFLLQVIFSAVPTNMSLFLSKNSIGSASTSSLLLALLTLSSFAAGLLYIKVSSRLKTHKETAPMLLIGLGFLTLSSSPVSRLLGLGVILIGFGTGLLIPTLILSATAAVSKDETSFALAIISSCLFLGQFASPFVSDAVQSVLGTQSVTMPFYISTGLAFLFMLYLTASKKGPWMALDY